MFYGSVCSTTCCALGVDPNQVQRSASQDYGHTSSEHWNSAQHHGTEKPDCSDDHRTINFVKADGLPQFQLGLTGNVSINQLFANAPHVATLNLAGFSLSDLAPPPTQRNPLYQQISVLRI